MTRKHYAALASPYCDVLLVNVTIDKGRLLAGFVYFEGGGLPEQITVFPPKKPAEQFTIWIPVKARSALTNVIMTSAEDAIELQLVV